MSLRTSRRSLLASGQVVDVQVPSVPISEIRARKWTKQLKTIGHLSIPKWVPGRKRQTGEIGRMTRSVRQHLAAPLELLSEYPSIRNHAARQVTPSAVVPPTIVQATVPSAAASLQAPVSGATTAVVISASPADRASVNPLAHPATVVRAPASALNHAALSNPHGANVSAVAVSSPAGGEFMRLASSNDPLLAHTVPSDEQLEMALEDLPMLDSDEDLPFGQLTEDQVPPVVAPAAVIASVGEVVNEQENVDDAVDNTAESTADGDDDDDDDDDSDSSSSGDDDDDDDGSANSAGGSPMPSPSPQTSPMPSRSPSP